MDRKIIALGTGIPESVKYFQTAFLIQNNATNLLIDTGGGSGILAELDSSGISLENIQNVFISHKHMDHIMGIFWILRFRGVDIYSGKAANLKIFSSKDNIELIKNISTFFLKKKVLDLFDHQIEFIEIDQNNVLDLDPWKVEFFNVNSPKEDQWGCKITFADGKILSYIGDEPFNESLRPICANNDYLFHDAFCLEKDKDIFKPQEIHHSTVKEAATNAQSLNVKNLLLFHTEDKSTFGNRKSLYVAEAKNEFSGNVIVPDDGEIIEF